MTVSISPSPVTHLDIGLSKEDQVRIDTLRSSQGFTLLKKIRWIRGMNDLLISFTKIKLKEKLMFFQLLSVMINAGVPIIRALYTLSMQVPNPRLQGVVKDLALQMEEGKTLSVGMEKFDFIFGEAERGMIASGEASGNLNNILRDLAKQAEKSAAIIAKVKGAMIYPAAVFSIMFICLFLMLTLVVPQLEDLFLSNEKALPTSTHILLKLSEWAQTRWLILVVLGILFGLGLVLVRNSKQGRYSIDLVVLYIPIFGELVRELMVSRFARLLSSLMNSGLPIVKALEINANAVGNEVYKRRILYAAQDVAQGIPLGENLTESRFLFPPSVASMVLVGEQTAKLNEVSSKIADFYEQEVDTAVASLSKLMEPLILLIMGVVVGFIVAAIMQPIMSLSDVSTLL